MKIISLEIKSVKIGRFFPKEDKVELDISFDDGADKDILKVVNISDPEGAAEDILLELRKIEKRINKNDENKELIVENYVNIVIKNEDNLLKEISEFVRNVGNKINEIKGKDVAEGYLDIIRELKNLKLDFTQEN